jgi:hypothetical protein
MSAWPADKLHSVHGSSARLLQGLNSLRLHFIGQQQQRRARWDRTSLRLPGYLTIALFNGGATRGAGKHGGIWPGQLAATRRFCKSGSGRASSELQELPPALVRSSHTHPARWQRPPGVKGLKSWASALIFGPG